MHRERRYRGDAVRNHKRVGERPLELELEGNGEPVVTVGCFKRDMHGRGVLGLCRLICFVTKLLCSQSKQSAEKVQFRRFLLLETSLVFAVSIF